MKVAAAMSLEIFRPSANSNSIQNRRILNQSLFGSDTANVLCRPSFAMASGVSGIVTSVAQIPFASSPPAGVMKPMFTPLSTA